MLDRRVLVEQSDLVRKMLEKRLAGPETLANVDRFYALETRRKECITEGDECRRLRNDLSPRIGGLMKAGRHEEAEALKNQVRIAAERARELEPLQAEVDAELDQILLTLPNLIDDIVPFGKGDEENEIMTVWGEPRVFDFAPQAHDDVGVRLGIVDMERAVRMSGARFSVLRGAGARLERSLINFFLDLHTQEHGYTEVMVPYIVSRSSMQGTGQLPKFEAELFRLAEPLNGQDAFLVPTAEVPVTNLHRDEILDADQLPLKYICFTPCFRAEAGSHGRDTKGLIRQHQFHKVEMVHITAPEGSDAAHQELTGNAERILQMLELPYRKVRVCSGEMSSAAAQQMDLEVWLPSQARYREISSCSNFRDYQARRLSLRYRLPADGKKGRVAFCHTLNGSGLAVGRTLVAILENHQQADGSVLVPKVLQPYMGGLDRIGPA